MDERAQYEVAGFSVDGLLGFLKITKEPIVHHGVRNGDVLFWAKEEFLALGNCRYCSPMIAWKVETPTRSKSFLLSSSLSLLLMLTAAALVKVTIHGLALRSAFNESTIAAMQVVDLPDPGSATARLFPLRVMTALAICICSADNI